MRRIHSGAILLSSTWLACLALGACGNESNGGDGTGGTATGGSASLGGAPASGGCRAMPAADPHIVVDQFGYLTDSEKIAVIRDPQTGYDAAETFVPGGTYALVNATTCATVTSGVPAAWNGGATDTSSGDRVWWFDFSSVTAAGDYYVLDTTKNLRSYVFTISDTVYRDVLKQAVRILFYQRAGQNKDAAHAGAGWADGPSHVGPLQDHNCRVYNDPNNAATEKDLWGGWYDAGDLNKYTSWIAGYVETLLRAYVERPSAWTDDYNIPESGNGIPDVLDEAKWGMDFLTRMQNTDGSVLTIVGEASASPPSSATGQSLYGTPSTATALATAATFAYGSRVYRTLGNPALATYADGLLARAKQAWSWAVANPNVTFYNNDKARGTSGLGAGQQQPDDWSTNHLDAAVQLFAATGDATYRSYVDANYSSAAMMNGYVAEWNDWIQDALIDYASTPGATASVASAIKTAYVNAVKGNGNLGTVLANPAPDPYMAWLDAYTWGSNQTKAAFGNVFYTVIAYNLDAATNANARKAAERYVHYIHGVNPFAMVYLTNRGAHGAEKSVTQIFHTWFADGSAKWDQTGVSTYGPAPGFMPGGPNPGYNWDGCCPATPDSSACSGNGAKCYAESVSPPKGQPAQKSYKDFNTGWPLNSWSVTEPSDGYQVKYIRLLSKFVR